MRYPEGRDHNLFFVAWMEGVRFALAHGATQYQSGQTAYAQKVKLGSRLDQAVGLFPPPRPRDQPRLPHASRR